MTITTTNTTTRNARNLIVDTLRAHIDTNGNSLDTTAVLSFTDTVNTSLGEIAPAIEISGLTNNCLAVFANTVRDDIALRGSEHVDKTAAYGAIVYLTDLNSNTPEATARVSRAIRIITQRARRLTTRIARTHPAAN